MGAGRATRRWSALPMSRGRRRATEEASRTARLTRLVIELARVHDEDTDRIAALAAAATGAIGASVVLDDGPRPDAGRDSSTTLELPTTAGAAGVLSLQFASPFPDDPASMAFLEAVAAACGTAVERLHLRRADRRLRADGEFLAEASIALAAALGADAVLDTLEKLAVAQLADSCTIVRGAGSDAASAAEPGGLSIALRGRSGVLATMVLDRVDRGFDFFDRAVAQEVAARAAQALDAALAYDDQATASVTLQRSLLPKALMRVPGLAFAARYVAAAEAQEVGGDFYDAIVCPDGRAVLVIGDVQGKGIDAATFTSAARHTLRETALAGMSPREMLLRVNATVIYGQQEQALVSDQDPRFVTTAVVALTPTDCGFHGVVASGGHPPPLVVRVNGDVRELHSPGIVLGVVDDPDFTEIEVELALADTVVLYTDGVTEQANYLDFDEAELGRLVRNRIGPADADAVAQLILDTVLLLAPGQPRDDLAVLVACVTAK